MSETSLLFRTSERHDLSAVRAELANDMNRCVAEIVNEKLREIAARKDIGGSQSVTSDATSDAALESPTFTPFNFDDIEPYENETS